MKQAYLTAIAAAFLAVACSPEQEPADVTPAPPLVEESDVSVATPPEEAADTAAADGSCLAEIGEEASAQLVDQCIQMSPATRPPCNAQNSCQMIRDEIARGCNFGDGSDNPEFCAQYEE